LRATARLFLCKGSQEDDMTPTLQRIAPIAAWLTREAGLDAPRPHRLTFAGASLTIDRGGRQWLPVSAHIKERYLVTFRAPAARLAALVPAPLTVDALDGYGFVSVCALDIRRMGVVGLPSLLRFDNRELLYRVGVRVGERPSFFTLRSDVSSPTLALLGRFSHYRLRRADFTLSRAEGRTRLVCRSHDAQADGDFEATPDAAEPPRDSLAAASISSTASPAPSAPTSSTTTRSP
jgi:hypothetical protein